MSDPSQPNPVRLGAAPAGLPTATPRSRDEHLGAVHESLDRLMTIEIRPRGGRLPSAVVASIHAICRVHQGEPLTGLAARRLISAIEPGDHVLIATGAGTAPSLPSGETDGPMGAAVLARALATGLGARPVLISASAHMPPVSAALHEVRPETGPVAATELFPLGPEQAQYAAESLLHTYEPAAVIFVETDGPGPDGRFHGVRGDCRAPRTIAHTHQLAAAARQRSVLTLGIGDGGNEIGFGAVREKIAQVLPGLGRCLNGCPGGLVTATATDVTVSASVSNWGAYAVTAALAAHLNDAGLLHTPEDEHRMVRACIAAGARDGATGAAGPLVDGIGIDIHAHVVALLHAIAETAVTDTRKALT